MDKSVDEWDKTHYTKGMKTKASDIGGLKATLCRYMVTLTDRYMAASGAKETTLGRNIVNDGSYLARFRNSENFQIKTYDQAITWFRSHWPQDLAFPELEIEITDPSADAEVS